MRGTPRHTRSSGISLGMVSRHKFLGGALETLLAREALGAVGSGLLVRGARGGTQRRWSCPRVEEGSYQSGDLTWRRPSLLWRASKSSTALPAERGQRSPRSFHQARPQRTTVSSTPAALHSFQSTRREGMRDGQGRLSTSGLI